LRSEKTLGKNSYAREFFSSWVYTDQIQNFKYTYKETRKARILPHEIR